MKTDWSMGFLKNRPGMIWVRSACPSGRWPRPRHLVILDLDYSRRLLLRHRRLRRNLPPPPLRLAPLDIIHIFKVSIHFYQIFKLTL